MQTLRLRFSALIAVALFLSGCTAPEVRTKIADQEVAGSYYRGDGLGYNVYLDLNADGSYSSKWTGCLGVYGRASGTWRVENAMVVLTPPASTDMMAKELGRLEIVGKEADMILVPDNDRKFYDQLGAHRYSCYQRHQRIDAGQIRTPRRITGVPFRNP